MKCPFCAALDTKVTDSRVSATGDVIRRRRECEGCARRFTTYERVEEMLPLVVKKDGRREAFDRQKVLGGLRRACDKRAVPLARLEETVEALERELIDIGDKEISSKSVGERVMVRLREIDPIGYVRFASVYRQFRDIDELRSEIDQFAELSGERNGSARPVRSEHAERGQG
ncbi:MAG: transcriptional regulator NrdR [Polyangiaceae bacterium]|nr:transcriptional regulator NrdR [Polyangiaceae bacterium]